MTAKRILSAVFTVGILLTVPVGAQKRDVPEAAGAADEDIVDVLGVGPVDLNQLPAELRDNFRAPAQIDDQPSQEQEAASMELLNSKREEVLPEEVLAEDILNGPAEESLPGEQAEPAGLRRAGGVQLPTPNAQLEAARKAWEEAAPQREAEAARRMSEARAKMPENAYLKALEQIERMQPDMSPASDPVPEPQSWLSGASQWLASLWNRGVEARAVAVTPCGQPWTQIGPAPFTFVTSATTNAGIVKYIAVDPSSGAGTPAVPQRIYLGTREGGLWNTSNAGGSWVTTTDNLPSPQKTSLEIQAIAVHPIDPDVIVAGTGQVVEGPSPVVDTPLNRSIGLLRSTNRGSTWEQIGPTWCLNTDTPCYVGNTCVKADPNPTQSVSKN